MKLDDNTRTAFHYLGLASVLLLIVLFVAWIFSLVTPTGDPSLLPFKQGYLLLPANTVAIAQDPLGSRLAKGFLMACMVAILLAGLAALIARSMSYTSTPWAARIGTWSFILLLLWATISACFLPKQITTLDMAGRVLGITHREPIIGDLTLPFAANTVEVPFERIGSIGAAFGYDGDQMCEHADMIMLTMRPPETAWTISQLPGEGEACPSAGAGESVEAAVRYLRRQTGIDDAQR